MENSPLLQQFELIESKVEQLIESCRYLENENRNLKGRVTQLEEELLEKVEAETKYKEVKSIIRNKIDNLMGKIEDIQKAT